MFQASEFPLSRANRKRREFIEQHVSIGNATLLEIGAMDTPVYRPGEAAVKFLDWFTTDELREFVRDKEKRHEERLVNVDFAVKEKRFAAHVEERFDLVLGCHVVEHVPDVIRWIQQIEALLRERGRLFLAVPDRRYTFDLQRGETDAVELLRCYDEDLENATYYQILRDLYYYRRVVARDVWSGAVRKGLPPKRFPIQEAMSRARRLSRQYTSVHCHVFSRPTFPELWEDLRETGLVHLEIQAIGDVVRNSNEFLVLFGLPE